jgi:hypothetical protein
MATHNRRKNVRTKRTADDRRSRTTGQEKAKPDVVERLLIELLRDRFGQRKRGATKRGARNISQAVTTAGVANGKGFELVGGELLRIRLCARPGLGRHVSSQEEHASEVGFQPVEVVYLDRALTADAEGIVQRLPAAAQLARVPWSHGPLVVRPGARLQVPASVGWSHIFIEYVNGDTVSARFGARAPVRLSAADLGLKRELDGPASPLWDLLIALCLGNGTCARMDTDAPNIGALRTRATRLSQHLCAVFGLNDPPLHVDKQTQTVRADFLARPETRRASTRRPPRS